MRGRKCRADGHALHSATSDASRVTSAGLTSSQRCSLLSATSEFNGLLTSTNSPAGHLRSRQWTAVSRGTAVDNMTSGNSIVSNGDASLHDFDPLACVSLDRPGLHVWRAESKHMVTLEPNDHGVFHEGSCYLVLRVGEDQSSSLHRWQGQHAMQLDVKTVEIFSREVDEIVGRASIFSREVQGNESHCFLRNFHDGVIYVEGKAKTSVACACNYVKRLYVIKGRSYVTASCTEPRPEKLVSSGAALLDGFPRMYLWLGASCDTISRVRAIQLARKIRNCQRKGKAQIIVVEERDEEQNAALMRKIKSYLTFCNNGSAIDTATLTKENPVTKVTKPEVTGSCPIINLHRVGGDRVLYDMPLAATSPLHQRFLLPTDSYLLDQGPNRSLYMWVGSRSKNPDVTEAVSRGQSFSAHRGYPSEQPVCRVTEGSEPADFKAGFLEWKERAGERGNLYSRSYSAGNIGRALFSRSDPRTVGKTSLLLDTDISLSSDGETETFRVDQDSLAPSWEMQPGVFLNSDCYVVWHRPDPASKLPSLSDNILFYWLGSRSDAATQKTCLRLCLTMACTLDQALVIRVLDDKEPQSLLSIFHNSMVVYDHDLLSAANEVTLYSVKECAQGSMRVQQVESKCSNLNTSAAYIILSPDRCVLWFGKKTGGAEREFAKTMLGFLDTDKMYSYDVVTEGKEPSFFWQLLGPTEPHEKEFTRQTLTRRSPRLTLCTCTGEAASFHTETDFQQENLTEMDIVILDVFDQLFIWCGKAVDEESRKQLIPMFLKAYLDADPAKRKETDINLWIVFQFSEPDAFRRHFAYWDKDGYGGEEAYALARKQLRQENARIDVDEQLLDKSGVRVARYPYSALMKRELPADVLEDHREHHLSDRDFQEVLKVSRYDFYRLPQWKQAQLLRAAHLAHVRPQQPRIPARHTCQYSTWAQQPPGSRGKEARLTAVE